MWLLIVAIYVAPPDSINWKGSWELGMTGLMERHFESKATCLESGAGVKTKLNKGMLAPVHTSCIQIPEHLNHPIRGSEIKTGSPD